jgi:hypothetical protein
MSDERFTLDTNILVSNIDRAAVRRLHVALTVLHNPA